MIRKAIIVVLTVAAVSTGVLSIALLSRPFPFVQGVQGMGNGRIDYDWTWGRSGSWLVFVRVLRPQEQGPRVSIDRPGFALVKFGNTYQVQVSVWIAMAITTLLAIYPTIAFIRGPLRRYRRRKKGLCVSCGYDLTGNVSGVCPECGTDIDS